MSRPGQTQLSKKAHQQLARLMHLHRATHPKRIAPRFGITPTYMRQIARENDFAPLLEVLELIK